jgi:HEPN domain-containing protein
MAFIPQPLNFSLCKKLAVIRLREAEILYEGRKYSGAYYLSGYTIELGLKAYYCKSVRKHTFPPKRKIIDDLYKHDLNKLLYVCELNRKLDSDVLMNTSLQKAWDAVKDWSEESRYIEIDKLKSESMLNSVKEVFQWIQTKW